MIRVAPRTAAAVAAVAVLGLSGCTGEDDPEAAPTGAATGGVGQATAEPVPAPSRTDEPVFAFTEADTTFLRQILPSHDQAIAVARLVVDRTGRDDFRQLASDTLAFREEQVGLLTDLASQAEEDIDPADHAAAGDAPSVVPDDEVAALADAEGDAFDVAAAELLARLDEGAVAVSDQALEAAEHPDVIIAAIDGIDRFEPEAATLRQWLETWGG